MGLSIALDSPFGGNLAASYFKIVQINLNNLAKVGKIDIAVWNDKAARDSGKQPILVVGIFVVNDTDQVSESGVLNSIGYQNVYEKTFTQIYAYLKTKKIQVIDQIIDLSQAQDC